MKLLTLLTTLIITLASSNVFAKTFVCINWFDDYRLEGIKEEKGTMFVGEDKGDTFIIRNNRREKITLTYFAKDIDFKYYSNKIYEGYTNIYGISTNVKYYTQDKESYDFGIVHITGFGILKTTFCNYQ